LVSKAAERGNPAAQFHLALKSIDGKGVPQSYSEAATWLKRAADQGYAPAQYGLGLAYSYGLGVPQDDNMSATWLRRAAAQGNADAQKALDSIQQRTANLPASHYQTATLEGWKSATHGSHCESTARARSNYDGTVDANGNTECSDSTLRVYSVLVGDYLGVFKNGRVGVPLHFNPMTTSWYLNESKRPNVRFDESYEFFASEDIGVGEEMYEIGIPTEPRLSEWVRARDLTVATCCEHDADRAESVQRGG
jgi:hypothetical protein